MLMNLKPQDIVVLLKILVAEKTMSYSALASELSMSPSEVHAAVRRAAIAGLIEQQSKEVKLKALEEYILHGLKYSFPVQRGAATRGIPTGYAAPPLAKEILSTDDLPPVWPDPNGDTRGHEIKPLYRTVPQAARKDQALYELLALVDAIRDGRARERNLATKELKKRLKPV